MKKKQILVEGHHCVGPHFTDEEFGLIKKNINQLEGLNTLADLFAVVGNSVRLKIVYLLYAHNELCVCDIAEILNMSDSAISQHLRKLKDKLIVKSRKDSQTVYYSLESKLFIDILAQYFVIPEVKNRFDLINQN
jgi:ArsR family transcriptional regulator, lead/cadmium/zinc/bismuth-responsive transcriptional repressor